MVSGDVMIGDASLLAESSLLCFACMNLVILGVRAAAWMIASGDTQGFCARIRRTWASSSFVGGFDAIFGIHEDFCQANTEYQRCSNRDEGYQVQWMPGGCRYQRR